jgi:hypothetical protein
MRLKSIHAVAIVLFVLGSILAVNNHDGWGWLFFIGFLCLTP